MKNEIRTCGKCPVLEINQFSQNKIYLFSHEVSPLVVALSLNNIPLLSKY